MSHLLTYPLAVFVVAFIVLSLATRAGVHVRRVSKHRQEDIGEDFKVVLGATLTLLGLVIGFSFSMAVARYDQRKNLEEGEANAIGTEYLRADLLPAADAAKARLLLRSYLDQRIAFHHVRDEGELAALLARTTQLQNELWASVRAAAATQPTPVTALAVAGMNDVLNSQSYTQAAWWNRLPESAWVLLVVIALFCNFLVGYGSRSLAKAVHLGTIFPLFIAVALAFVADIASPRHGMIRVQPQNLQALAASLP